MGMLTTTPIALIKKVQNSDEGRHNKKQHKTMKTKENKCNTRNQQKQRKTTDNTDTHIKYKEKQI